MVTQNTIENLAQRLYTILSFLEEVKRRDGKTMNFEYLKTIYDLIEDNRYFIVFLEAILKEDKIDTLDFENDIKPIMDSCNKTETALDIKI